MVNSEQIRFHQKGQVEIKEKISEPSARSYMPEKESSGWGCYFESGSSNFGVGAGVILLTVRF